MNLELLAPRQIPDRIDSTLELPPNTYYPGNNCSADDSLSAAAAAGQDKTSTTTSANEGRVISLDDKAVQFVSFNRRGSYIAVGYGNGILAVYDMLTRTLSGLYHYQQQQQPIDSSTTDTEVNETTTPTTGAAISSNGVTCISWSRRSRTILTGSIGSREVWLVDATHPFGPECAIPISIETTIKDKDAAVSNKDISSHTASAIVDDDNESETEKNRPSGSSGDGSGAQQQRSSSFLNNGGNNFVRRTGKLQVTVLPSLTTTTTSSTDTVTRPTQPRERQTLVAASSYTKAAAASNRYPVVQFQLPAAVGATLQIHPRDNCSGHAVLENGSIIAFRVPIDSFDVDGGDDQNDDVNDKSKSPSDIPPVVRCTTIFRSDEHFVTCSAWDTHHVPAGRNGDSTHEGERLYATTRDGKLLGFDVSSIFNALAQSEKQKTSPAIPMVEPKFVISIPGGAHTWQIAVNRNGSHLVVNSSDAAIRLYDTKECWAMASGVGSDDTGEINVKPKFIFQDVVTKVKFVSCDLSNDGEYLVGCTNASESGRYELYIWNTQTGALMDKLSGATVEASCVAWHPTRSFIAVATSDGLVDVWGHKMSWTQFAPDFQALPANVEYVECEDEFDMVVVTENKDTTNKDEEPPTAIITENVVGKDSKENSNSNDKDDDENESVDVVTIEKVPVFQSDSEEEEHVFYFETRIAKPPQAS